ncbi:FAD binding domain protein [Thozetella sp. PMI_491]|nr:FAD binding domain protein [Thozetella sp. PMI_491]
MSWTAAAAFASSLGTVESQLIRQDSAGFDPVTALAELGLNASNFVTGAPSATLVGVTARETAQRQAKINPCAYSCASLELVYPGQVYYPSSSGYNYAQSGYWSLQQADVDPFCVFEPSIAVGISVTVLLSRLTRCPFAVKSGGHAAFANASNIGGGITINFANMKSIVRSSDGNTTSIQPGNTWYDVYSTLGEQNVTVVGGRVAAIGVGGLTLGGGISFFSGKYGWACDNVVNYELVTAVGAIIDVNETSYPDLYWALRGGGNNFGIVTRFDLETYPQGMMWGGSLAYLPNYTSTILNATYQYALDSSSDQNAALITAFAYANGLWLAVADLEYAIPVEHPAIFDTFLNTPSIQDTTAIKGLPEITLEFNASNPGGLRETYWTATFKADPMLLSFIVNEFEQDFAPLVNVSGIVPSCVLQIITTDELSHMSKRGGNALGITIGDGPLLLLNIAIMWADATADDAILEASQRVIDNTVSQARAWGLDNEYLYMNYASQFQDVVSSYNATNHARLVSIAKKYDPTGVFQKLQPGYFKLGSTVS